jgi:hypothetical protein
VNRQQIAEIVQLSNTLKIDTFNNILLQTQLEDIAPLLGEKLFNDIMKFPENYNEILNGSVYDYKGITYSNYGLTPVIAYYFDARYKMFGNLIDTPFSNVVKLNENSMPISDKMKDAVYQSKRQTAFTIWKSLENFLIRTNNVLFNELCLYEKKKKYYNFTKIE